MTTSSTPLRVHGAVRSLVALAAVLATTVGAGTPALAATVVERAEGATRAATAVALSRSTYPDDPPPCPEGAICEPYALPNTVILVSDGGFPDALAAAPLAGRGAPLLLTGRDRLGEATQEEIRRIRPADAVVVGGERAVGRAVEDQLRGLGVQRIERVAGEDRYRTAALVADRVLGRSDDGVAYLAAGAGHEPDSGWQDGVAVAAESARQGRPLLLSDPQALSAPTEEYLTGEDGVRRVVLVGGTAALSEAVEEAVQRSGKETSRVAGADRYGTSVAVAASARMAEAEPVPASPETVFVATGSGYADALAAGPATAARNGLLVLVDGMDLDSSPAARDWLAEHAEEIERCVLVGGDAAISARVEEQIRAILGG